ncbi:MAG TPA: 4-hydroxy-3-methylbut-2-en-1-yl diphosphate synthase [Verrucomicrobiales bacterium]|nr:4-hydroxy-3-methylbut-2-en-1-yl diphosphate synthase [Verrucomicrobiales bacterium]|tara:strand:+ start:569 stop:2344 length:1776 start_codon:yes stop_codon:yes gene_type:complete
MQYCASPYRYNRRASRPVVVGDPENGGVVVGGDHPVVRQSMLTSDTLDTEACVDQSMALVEVGCQIVRITAQTKRYAANLEQIVAGIRKRGSNVPVVADIHFKPAAAMEAVKWVEMVRVNPGNYADSKKFATHEYTDAEYAEELARIEESFGPLVDECKRLKRAMRIGTNHGSLSDRIMNRYGDTPLGMVESALEFARIARDRGFHNFKFSMKSSNPKVMIECYRLLATRLAELGPDWNYPLHLGVTEAGEGEDGRIKSAIGIGSLLCDGLGDTIRVSLTEDSPNEIAVCNDLLEQIPLLTSPDSKVDEVSLSYDPFEYERRNSTEINLGEGILCGGDQTIRVIVGQNAWDKLASQIRPGDDVRPEGIYENLDLLELDPSEEFEIDDDSQMITVVDGVDLPTITAFRLLAAKLSAKGKTNPILLKDTLVFGEVPLEPNVALLRASVVIGALLCDGIGDAILVRGESGAGQSLRLAYNILQAAGCRTFKTDYVACPSCGRTLFDLQEVTARIKARTEHLKGVKVAIMGCIVNGPGEMADADFGYVGGAPGKINLYVGKSPVRFGIPEAEAVESLVNLIKEHNKWVEPVQADS